MIVKDTALDHYDFFNKSINKATSKVKLHSQEMISTQVGSTLAIENAHRNLLDMKNDE